MACKMRMTYCRSAGAQDEHRDLRPRRRAVLREVGFAGVANTGGAVFPRAHGCALRTDAVPS
eukprot:3400485-Pyramimonas_sp.AAC.1